MSNLPAGFEVLDEMSWDDEIEEEGGFILLPEGDYDFEVVNLERGRFGGSEKMQACPKATLDIRVKTGDGKQATIKH
ncbi:MAG TPA: DUF669 domain-containing protein, partial [Syntrophomonas wolfei]|nr:DUF669 domain-containing protein [Syntrophomonas wolfei]